MSNDAKEIVRHLALDADGTIKPKWDLRSIFDDVFTIHAPRPTYKDYEKACIRCGSEPMPKDQWALLFGE